jgi:hydroxyacylglutathione hydrolase
VSDEGEATEPQAPQPYAVALADAAELIEGGATLIDVRHDYEYAAGHLEGARNLEMNELTAHAEEIPRDRPVLFYCRTGNRSSMAADAFVQAGYDAHNLGGGLEAWAADGRPLDPADGEIVAPRPPSVPSPPA